MPCQINFICVFHFIRQKNIVVSKQRYDIQHVDLIFCGKLIIRRLFDKQFLPQFFQHTCLLLSVLFRHGPFRFLCIRFRKVRDIDDAVFNQCIIHIVYCDQNGRTSRVFLWHILFDIPDSGNHDTRNLLFQDIVGCSLQFGIQGQVNIVSGTRLHIIRRFNHFTETVYIDHLRPLFSPQNIFHGGLDTRNAHLIIQSISGVPLQILNIFTDYRHSPFPHIRGDGGCDIFLVAVGGKRKPHSQNL